jgi:hypothetical protein
MRSAFSRKRAAHLMASPYVSTALSLVVCSSTITAPMPSSPKRAVSCFRAPAIRLSGKKSRLPTITPRVTGRVVADGRAATCVSLCASMETSALGAAGRGAAPWG